MIKQIVQHPVVKVILSTVFILFGTFAFKEVLTKPILSGVISDDLVAKLIGATISTLVIVGLYYLVLRFYFKRDFSEFSRKYALKELTIGFFVGFLAIASVVSILYFIGFYEITGINSILPFMATFTLVMGGVMMEEVVFRGLLLNTLEKWKGTNLALFVSAIIFQLPHFMNPHEAALPALGGFLFGVATGCMYTATRRLWVPFAFHLGWNIAQPFFGTTLSGIGGFNFLFQTNITGPELLTGSAFGIEDSLLSILTLMLLSLYYYRQTRKKGYLVKMSSPSLAMEAN